MTAYLGMIIKSKDSTIYDLKNCIARLHDTIIEKEKVYKKVIIDSFHLNVLMNSKTNWPLQETHRVQLQNMAIEMLQVFFNF